MIKDTYKTLTKPSAEVLFKEKNSKFYGYAFHVNSEEEIKEYLEELKKTHHQARHWCYAWQIGKEEGQRQFRANDDGEPSNSAGMPIYGQLLSFDLTNVLVVVVRYFGGTKLGVGGLIQAYKTAAHLALESGNIEERTIDRIYEIKMDYPELNVVMRLIKENNLAIINQEMGLDCRICINVRLSLAEEIFERFDAIYKVKISEVEN